MARLQNNNKYVNNCCLWIAYSVFFFVCVGTWQETRNYFLILYVVYIVLWVWFGCERARKYFVFQLQLHKSFVRVWMLVVGNKLEKKSIDKKYTQSMFKGYLILLIKNVISKICFLNLLIFFDTKLNFEIYLRIFILTLVKFVRRSSNSTKTLWEKITG